MVDSTIDLGRGVEVACTISRILRSFARFFIDPLPTWFLDLSMFSVAFFGGV